jgi:hypothetical protein
VWLTRALAWGLATRHGDRRRVMPWDRAAPTVVPRPTVNTAARATNRSQPSRNGRPSGGRADEYEFELEGEI